MKMSCLKLEGTGIWVTLKKKKKNDFVSQMDANGVNGYLTITVSFTVCLNTVLHTWTWPYLSWDCEPHIIIVSVTQGWPLTSWAGQSCDYFILRQLPMMQSACVPICQVPDPKSRPDITFPSLKVCLVFPICLPFVFFGKQRKASLAPSYRIYSPSFTGFIIIWFRGKWKSQITCVEPPVLVWVFYESSSLWGLISSRCLTKPFRLPSQVLVLRYGSWWVWNRFCFQTSPLDHLNLSPPWPSNEIPAPLSRHHVTFFCF